MKKKILLLLFLNMFLNMDNFASICIEKKNSKIYSDTIPDDFFSVEIHFTTKVVKKYFQVPRYFLKKQRKTHFKGVLYTKMKNERYIGIICMVREFEQYYILFGLNSSLTKQTDCMVIKKICADCNYENRWTAFISGGSSKIEVKYIDINIRTTALHPDEMKTLRLEYWILDENGKFELLKELNDSE